LNKNKPLVSIIIPTKNSAGTLEACLKSISNQTYPNIETIVVDNNSVDQTIRIARHYGASVYLKGPERCTQVNFGVQNAKGKYAYRVDSDFVLDPHVVEQAVEVCETQGYDAVAVHNTSDETVSFWAKVRKMERDTYRDDGVHIGSRFWKKTAFDSIDGFDVDLVAGDDYDLQNRLLRKGYKIGRIQAQETHIGEPKTLSEIFRKHYYYGRNIGRFIQKNQDKAIAQLSPIRLSLLQGFSKSSHEPQLIVGYLLYQLLRYTAAAMGLLSSKLARN
jgi:glycosyltransferase involved in cell wall biosynthesis